MNIRMKLKFVLVLVIALSLLGTPVSAQTTTTGKISGTLYDLHGNPVTWTTVQVRVVRKSNGNQVASTFSNPTNGSFTLTGLPLGVNLAVVASDEDPDMDGYQGEYYNNVNDLDWAENILLTSGAPNRSNINIFLGSGELGATIEQFTFNVRAGRLLNDVDIRRAIAYGTNRPVLLHKAFLPNNNLGVVMHTMVSPGLGHQAAQDDLTVYTYDPTMAQNILTSAGWIDTDSDGIRDDGSGNDLELDFKTTPASARVESANLFTQQMQAIGIRVNATFVPAGDFFSDDPAVSPLAAGNFDIAEFAWVLYENDTLLGTYNTGDGQNFGGYSSSMLDGYYNGARSAKVAGNQASFQSNALLWQQTYSADLPSLPLFTRKSIGSADVETGTNVAATSDNATATFSNVTESGSFGIVASGYHPNDLPAGYTPGDPNVYELGSSADFDAANVCIQYDISRMSTANEYFLRMFHLEDLTTWVDVTSSLNVDENEICGNFTSFSVVALMYSDDNGGSISGIVRDESGVPITGTSIQVAAERQDGQVLANTDSNPADGSYTIGGLPLGVQLIVKVNGDGVYGAEYYEEAVLRGNSTIFNLTQITPSYSGVDFTLPPAKPGTTIEHLTFNVRPGRVLNNLDIRRAIAFGTDRERILNEAFLSNEIFLGGGYHFGVVLNSLITPGYWSQPSHDQVNIYPYDPAQANAILDAAGIVDTNNNSVREVIPGNDIVLDFKTTPAPARVASAAIFTENMAAIGIQVNATLVPAGEFFTDDPNVSPLAAGNFDVAEFAWGGGDHNLDDNYLWRIYETDNFQNYGGYSNATVDAELAAAFSATSRASLLPHMLAYFAETTDNMPSLPMFTRVLGTPVNTSSGLNKTANLASIGVTVKYENAASAGTTGGYRSEIHPDDLPDYLAQMLDVYEIGSNVNMATGTGAIICFKYDDTGLTATQELRLQIYHLGMIGTRSWSNITSSLNTSTNSICGRTTSFSTFAVGYPDGPVVNSIKRANTNPTSAYSVDFNVAFSDPVINVDVDDFVVTAVGVVDASVTGVTGSGAAYKVTVFTGSGNGTLRLDVVDNDSIKDATNKSLGGGGSGNGDFLNGEIYTVQKSASVSGIPALLSPASGGMVSTLQPKLDWRDSSPPAYYYQLQVSRNNIFTDVVLDETHISASEFTFTSDLDPGTRHYWRVRAFNVNDVASGWSTVWNFRTPLAAPSLLSPPNTVPPTQLDNDRPAFDWLEVENAAQYNIQVSASQSFGTLLVSATVNASEYNTVNDLPQNKVLYWRVRARNPIVTGPWSETWSFKTGNPPTVPALVSPANNALVKVYPLLLDWGNSTNPSGMTFKRYEVKVDDDPTFGSPLLGMTANETITDSKITLDETELDPNTRYYWRVRAVNEVGGVEHFSAWSAVRSFRTALLAPELVSPSNGEPLNNVRPTLTWNDPNVIGPAPVSFTVQIAVVSNFSTLVHSKTVPTTSYSVPVNLPMSRTLYWRVRANGANGPSLWSASSFLTGRPPSVPALVAPANNALVKTYTPLLDWGNSTLPAGTIFLRYEIEVDDDPVFGSPLTATRDTLTDSQFTPDPALDANTRYYWRVRAVNEVGGMEHFSAWSAVRSFRTVIPAPTLFSPAHLGTVDSLQPVFDWEDASGPGLITSYTIQVSTSPGFGTFLVNSTTVSSTYTMLKNLPAGKSIYWRVRVNGANGPSAWSTFQFTTP